MAKRLFAIFAGVLVAVLTIGAVEALNSLIYPYPPDVDPSNMAQMEKHVRGLPTGAFVGIIVAWVLGTLVGCAVATRLAPTGMKMRTGVTVGVVILAFTVANLIMIPWHPLWVWPVGLGSIAVATFVGWKIGERISPKG